MRGAGQNPRGALTLLQAAKKQPLQRMSVDEAGNMAEPVSKDEGWVLLEKAVASGAMLKQDKLRAQKKESTIPMRSKDEVKSPAKAAARAARGSAAPNTVKAGSNSRIVAGDDVGSNAGKSAASKTAAIDPIDAWNSDKPMPRMKRPEELYELIRICSIPLWDVEGHSQEPFRKEEIGIQQVRMCGRRWYEFLEDEDLIDVGKDPARFPVLIRQRFLEVRCCCVR